MKVIKVGIIDDDGSKVTQMMAYLLYGMKDASKQKADTGKIYGVSAVYFNFL